MRLSVLVNGKSHCLGPLGYPPPVSLVFAEESQWPQPWGLTGMGLPGLYHFSSSSAVSEDGVIWMSALLIWELSHHGFPRLSAMASHFRGSSKPAPYTAPWKFSHGGMLGWLFVSCLSGITDLVSWAPVAWNHCGIYCINFLVVSGRRLFPFILLHPR